MSTDTKIKTLIFNKLTQEQYNNADKVPTEFYLTPDDTDEKLAAKQDKLTAGTNITIVDNVISATGGGSSNEYNKDNLKPGYEVEIGNTYPDDFLFIVNLTSSESKNFNKNILLKDDGVIENVQQHFNLNSYTLDTYHSNYGTTGGVRTLIYDLDGYVRNGIINNDWTYECWFYQGKANQSTSDMFYLYDPNGNNLNVKTNGYLYVNTEYISSGKISTVKWTSGVWHHGAVTYNNSTKELRVYLDGAISQTYTLPTDIFKMGDMKLQVDSGNTCFSYWQGISIRKGLKYTGDSFVVPTALLTVPTATNVQEIHSLSLRNLPSNLQTIKNIVNQEKDWAGTNEYPSYQLFLDTVSNLAKKDLSNVINPNIDYVVESKLPTADDPTWYRKYKSGWLEQGGLAKSNADVTVTLLKPFADTNYSVQCTNRRLSTSDGWGWIFVLNMTTTSFMARACYAGGDITDINAMWEARGVGKKDIVHMYQYESTGPMGRVFVYADKPGTEYLDQEPAYSEPYDTGIQVGVMRSFGENDIYLESSDTSIVQSSQATYIGVYNE